MKGWNSAIKRLNYLFLQQNRRPDASSKEELRPNIRVSPNLSVTLSCNNQTKLSDALQQPKMLSHPAQFRKLTIWQLDEQEELLQQIFNHRQITLKGKQCNSIDRYMMYSSLQCGENFCRSRNQIEVKKIGNSSFDACRHKQFSTAVGVKYLDNLTCLTGFKYLKNLKLWSRLIVFCQQQFQLT